MWHETSDLNYVEKRKGGSEKQNKLPLCENPRKGRGDGLGARLNCGYLSFQQQTFLITVLHHNADYISCHPHP